MSIPKRLGQYEGDLPYRDHPCSVERCSLAPEHEGPHADVSLSGLVLDVWDEPEVDAAALEIVERLNGIRDSLMAEIASAYSDVRDLLRDPATLANPGLTELLEQAESDIERDANNVGPSEDESTWGTELEQLAAWRHKKAKRRTEA